MSIQAMKQALQFANDITRGKYKGNSVEISDALRLAIEQAERQEQVTWVLPDIHPVVLLRTHRFFRGLRR